MFSYFQKLPPTLETSSFKSLKTHNPIATVEFEKEGQSISTICNDVKHNRYAISLGNGNVIIVENKTVTRLVTEPDDSGNDSSDDDDDNVSIAEIDALAFVNKNLIAIARSDYCKQSFYIQVWNIEANKCIAELKHNNQITALAVSTSGKLFSASRDNKIYVWNLQSLTSITPIQLNARWNFIADSLVNICRYMPLLSDTLTYLTGYMLLSEKKDWVTLLTPLDNGTVAYGTCDAIVGIIDDNGNCIKEVKAGEKEKWRIGIDWFGTSYQHITSLVECNNVLISSSRDGTLRIWNKHTLEFIHKLYTPDHKYHTSIHSMMNIQNYIIAIASDKNLYIWNMKSWECEKIITNITNVYQIKASAEDDILLFENGHRKRMVHKIPLHVCLNHSQELTFNFESIKENQSRGLKLSG